MTISPASLSSVAIRFVVGCHAAGQRPAAAARTAGRPVTVVSDRGPLVGVEHDDERIFRGIAYAAPPTGERRWRPRVPATAWDSPRDATREGHACLQPREQHMTLDLRATVGAHLKRAVCELWDSVDRTR